MSKSTKKTQAPSMGPVLHWKSGTYTEPMQKHDAIEWNNTVQMVKYIMERTDKLAKSKTAKLSQLEVEDLLDFATWAVNEYEDPLMDELATRIPVLTSLAESTRIIKDAPKKDLYIARGVVHTHRFLIRSMLLGMYESTLETMKQIQFAIKNKKDSPISVNDFKLQSHDEDYVNYLIKNNIFRKSDIKKAFPTDIFKEFAAFRAAYKTMKEARKKPSK